MHSEFMEALENSPVIAAVKDDDGLKKMFRNRQFHCVLFSMAISAIFLRL